MTDADRALAIIDSPAVRNASTGAPGSPATTWLPIDLAAIIAGIQAGETVGPVPALMARDDGPCLLYPGEVHSLAGEPETGKGWIALAAAAEVISSGQRVLYLDFEDSPASIVTRLIALAAAPEAIVERFAYVRPSDPFSPGALALLLNGQAYALTILDGLSEAYALLGLDPYSNLDAAKFLATLARPVAATGSAVLLIDHVVKSKETRGRYALGAQHKLAGIAVAYSTDAITTPSRTTAGQIKVKVEKDRHGHVRGHAQSGVIAIAHIAPEDDGERVTVTLEPPETTTGESGEFRPTVLMRRVWDFVKDEPGASRNAIRDGVTGRGAWIDKALHLLIAEGYIDRRRDGQTYAHHAVREYENQPGPTESQPSPGPGSRTGSGGSPPLRDPDPGPSELGLSDRVPGPSTPLFGDPSA